VAKHCAPIFFVLKKTANNGIITSGTAPLNETQKDYTFPLYLVIGTKSECLTALQTLASNDLI
jgi:hypothetical protein